MTKTNPQLLIVEDTPQTRLLIEEIVSYVLPDYDIEAVRDPRDALKHIEKRRPDIIITDLKMPGMDGYAFIEKLEGNPDTSGIHLVIMTAFANQDEDVLIRRKLTKMGIERRVPILTKPFSIQGLRQTILELADPEKAKTVKPIVISTDQAIGNDSHNAVTEPVRSVSDKLVDKKPSLPAGKAATTGEEATRPAAAVQDKPRVKKPAAKKPATTSGKTATPTADEEVTQPAVDVNNDNDDIDKAGKTDSTAATKKPAADKSKKDDDQ